MRRSVLIAAALAVCLAAVAALLVRGYLNTPLAVPAVGYRLDIPPGTALADIGRQLGDDGITRWPALLRIYGRLTGQSAQIKAGEYQILPGTTPVSLLRNLVSGRVILHKLTLVEGWSIAEVLAALADAQPALEQTLKVTGATDLARELGLPWSSAEGAFLPETYLYSRGTTDRDLLLRAHAALIERLDQAWESRQPDLPLASPYELLVLASIIERETALASERPLIAGVFVRRLRLGMRLQTDPTVIYGLGSSFDGNLTRRHLETDSPWNTYTRTGLPPTPIAMPGGAAIDAAASPAPGTALYFVATGKGDGGHKFSATLREHDAAVRDYLATLRRQNRKQGFQGDKNSR
jgi:UPF0755 protein